jgi:UDP-N-acetylmuramate dehydrogenase
VFANFPDQSVGRLIDDLGLKGTRVGDAEVSAQHGNFIVNRGAARASDIVALIEILAESITKSTGRTPRLEVEIWRDER